jgi:hypothetical protein
MIDVARTPEGSNELCLFCIDTQSDVVDDRVITLDFNSYPDIACTCKVKTHVDCWMKYILHKGHIECPICHKLFQDQDAILRLPTPPTESNHLQMHQNPMMSVGNTQSQSPIIMVPIPLGVHPPPVYPPPDNEQVWCTGRRSRNEGCILLTIVLVICIVIVVYRV